MIPPPPKPQPPAEPAPGAGFKPVEILVINTPEMLKTIGDPLRLNIIEILRQEALTVKQIAARLNQPASKLYYHVAELEEAGFVTQVDTRVKSGIIEKYYRNSSDHFMVDPKLLNASAEQGSALSMLVSAVFGSTIDDLNRSLNAGLFNLSGEESWQEVNFVMTGSYFRLRKENVAEFVKKFNEILQQLGAEERQVLANGEQPASVSYGCTIAFYPRVEAGKQDRAID